MNNARLLLLCQTHAHVAALMDCLPHIKANYGWVWAVYSPAVLADPAVVEKEFDQQIADLTRAMKDCYGREDGAGGDAYKVKRDAAILEKSAKVKEAWKSLGKEAQDAAVMRLFKPFFDSIHGVEGMSCSITQAQDHFETAAHVEFQNSLKARMREGYLPGEYVVAWPTSLPKLKASEFVTGMTATPITQMACPPLAPQTAPTAAKKKGRPPMDARLKQLMQMTLDDLGPIAFELGIKPADPIAGNRMKLVYHIFELEKENTAKELAAM